MPSYRALSKNAHAGQRLKRNSSHAFANGEALAPLVKQELAKACMGLPIAFVQTGNTFAPMAVQGFEPGKNLCVGPNGQWLGNYIPALYRGYPFALLPDHNGQLALCFDSDSQLVNEVEGEALFDANGQPSQAIQNVLNFLNQIEQDRKLTQRLCQSLAEHKLLQPWPIKVQIEGGMEKSIAGLLRIDEAALNQLGHTALQALQRSGALAIAYMQLLSMQHVGTLANLSRVQANFQQDQGGQALAGETSGELDLEFLNASGTFSFDTK